MDSLWALAHEELEPEARAQRVACLKEDGDLREKAASVCGAHAWLQDAARAMEWTDEELVDRVLAAMDAEADDGHSAKSTGRVIDARGLFRSRAGRSWIMGAAAAAVVLLVVLPQVWRPRLQFAEAEVVAYSVRSDAAPAQVTPALQDQAGRCWEQLEQSISESVQAKGFRLPLHLTLTFRYQALAGEAFSIRVRALNRKGEVVDEWTGDYTGHAAFRAHVGRSADVIAEDLRGLQRADRGV